MKRIEALWPFPVSKVWGGERLAQWKGFGKEVLPLGETWEVSVLQEGPSVLEDGRSLGEVIDESAIPYLVKFIDTTDNLSVQVHPQDDYARRVENSSGKTECWIILEADKGAGIYLGFKEGITKEKFEEVCRNGGNAAECLNFHTVSRGDFFFVPAGSIHAIGKGVTLAEVQQSSGVTYRVWDWNRMGLDGKPRDLHLEKALEVIHFDYKENTLECFNYQKEILEKGTHKVLEHPDFQIDVITLKPGEEFNLPASHRKRLRSVVILDGAIIAEESKLKSYRSYLLSSEEEYHFQGGDLSKNSVFLLIS